MFVQSEKFIESHGDRFGDVSIYGQEGQLRKNVSVDWSVRETVRAKLRILVKRILRKCNYPPDLEQRAIDVVLRQAETLSEAWE